VSPLTCVLIAGATFSATLIPFAAPAGADQVSQQITSLQKQAAQLSSEMLLEQLQIGGYQQQYNQAIASVQRDQQQAAGIRGAIGRVQQRIGRATTELQQAAVNAYENGGAAVGVTPLFTDQRAESDSTEYQQVMANSLTDAVDQLRSARAALRAKQATLEQVEAQDQASQNDAQSLLRQSQDTQQELQQQSAQVQGQLAVDVAQQQAQQAAAAAAAVAAAQAQAAAAAQAQAAAQTKATSQAKATSLQVASPSAPGADPALNPFLQCVVQAESSGNYQAASPTGTYMGAFQFSQSTWNDAASLAGLSTLVGVPPTQASPAQQDEVAVALYSADGSAPWYDPCSTG